MPIQPSEVANLLMVVVLGPIIIIAVRRATPVLLVPASVALGLMTAGYVATLLEGFALPEFFNLVEHASYGAAGFAFVWLALICRRMLGTTKAGSR